MGVSVKHSFIIVLLGVVLVKLVKEVYAIVYVDDNGAIKFIGEDISSGGYPYASTEFSHNLAYPTRELAQQYLNIIDQFYMIKFLTGIKRDSISIKKLQTFIID